MWSSTTGFLALCCLAALVATAPFGFLARRQFESRLRAEHSSVLAQLDSPNEFDSVASLGLVMGRRYLQLPDSEAHRLGEKYRMLSVVLASEFVSLIVFGCANSALQ
jgi:hypothetical protein